MTRPPWAPEIEIRPALAAELIGTQFLALNGVPVPSRTGPGRVSADAA